MSLPSCVLVKLPFNPNQGKAKSIVQLLRQGLLDGFVARGTYESFVHTDMDTSTHLRTEDNVKIW